MIAASRLELASRSAHSASCRWQVAPLRSRHGLGSRLPVVDGLLQSRVLVVRRLKKTTLTAPAQPGDSHSSSTDDAPNSPTVNPQKPPTAGEQLDSQKTRKRTAMETPDMISSQLTRGLGWFAFLAIGSLGEQVKTRLEVAREEADAQDVSGAVTELESGVQYQDIRLGGGRLPQKRDLVVLDFRLSVNGEIIEDTFKRGKPIVFPFRSRPFTGGICAGCEEALSTMKAGGKRLVTVPPQVGFGSAAYSVRGTRHAADKDVVVPANSTLEYELNLIRVSLPPS